jgi:hypothetical protein
MCTDTKLRTVAETLVLNGQLRGTPDGAVTDDMKTPAYLICRSTRRLVVTAEDLLRQNPRPRPTLHRLILGLCSRPGPTRDADPVAPSYT